MSYAEQTYNEYYKNLVITTFELETYQEFSLRYITFNEALNLYSRLTFYLLELKDETSILAFYLTPNLREKYLKLYESLLPLVEIHLQDAVAKEYQTIPKKTITTARSITHYLKSKKSLDCSQRYLLHFNETLLEHTACIQAEYIPNEVSLL